MSPPWLVPVLSLHSDPQTQPLVTLNDFGYRVGLGCAHDPFGGIVGVGKMLPDAALALNVAPDLYSSKFSDQKVSAARQFEASVPTVARTNKDALTCQFLHLNMIPSS